MPVAGGDQAGFAGDAQQHALGVGFAQTDGFAPGDAGDQGRQVVHGVDRLGSPRRQRGQPGMGRDLGVFGQGAAVAADIDDQVVDEQVAEIAEPLIHGGDAGLVRVQVEPVFRQRGRGGGARPARFLGVFAQDDEIIGEADQVKTRGLHVAVEVVEHEIGHQRAQG